ncbi:hypothetical protein ABF215_11785 [Fusobacterium sp. THCT13E1]
MKKIISILIGAVLIFTIIGCGNKKAMTARDFENKMGKNGYEVINITSQYPSKAIKDVLIAGKDGYQIEFFIVENVDVAVSSYNLNKETFEKSKGNKSVQTQKTVGNTSRFTLKTNSKYKVISRVENTFIFINAPQEKSEEIDTVLKELNY